MGKLVWLFGMILYANLAVVFTFLLVVCVHPLAGIIPILPAFILAIREVNRRSKVIMSEAFETSPEKWKKAFAEYITLVEKKKKQK